MNILADESVDQQIVEQLRRAGHQVIYIAETEPGISDTEVLGLANRKSSLLLTADRDFGELVFRQKLISVGVVLIRLAGLSTSQKGKITTQAIQEHETEFLQAFSVITPDAVRIRRLGP